MFAFNKIDWKNGLVLKHFTRWITKDVKIFLLLFQKLVPAERHVNGRAFRQILFSGRYLHNHLLSFDFFKWYVGFFSQVFCNRYFLFSIMCLYKTCFSLKFMVYLKYCQRNKCFKFKNFYCKLHFYFLAKKH